MGLGPLVNPLNINVAVILLIHLFIRLSRYYIWREGKKGKKKEDKTFYSNNGKANLFPWYLKVVRIGGKTKTATNCKDKISEKSAYTRLRQSEQENYQQWIIEFQFRILHFYCSEKCPIPPIFRSSPFCIWPKGVDFERYVFHILARSLHLQNKILKIILITITPIHKWLYPWVWVVGSVFTTIWSWYTPGFILNCFLPVLAEQAVLFSIFNALSCRFLESVSTMYKWGLRIYKNRETTNRKREKSI